MSRKMIWQQKRTVVIGFLTDFFAVEPQNPGREGHLLQTHPPCGWKLCPLLYQYLVTSLVTCTLALIRLFPVTGCIVGHSWFFCYGRQQKIVWDLSKPQLCRNSHENDTERDLINCVFISRFELIRKNILRMLWIYWTWLRKSHSDSCVNPSTKPSQLKIIECSQ